MRWRPVIAVIVVATAFSASAETGKYVIVDGDASDVCTAYLRSLNAEELHQPLVCERPLHGDEIQAPQWRKWDLAQHVALYFDITEFFGDRSPGREISRQELEWIGNRAKHDLSPHLDVASVDIDNDGTVDVIVRYKNGLCGYAETYGMPILVLDESGSRINRTKTMSLLQNCEQDRFSGECKPAPFHYMFSQYGVFTYRLEAYFDKVSGGSASGDKIAVYRIAGEKVGRACEFQYVRKSQGGRP